MYPAVGLQQHFAVHGVASMRPSLHPPPQTDMTCSVTLAVALSGSRLSGEPLKAATPLNATHTHLI